MEDRPEICARVLVRIPGYRCGQFPEVAVLLEEGNGEALYVEDEIPGSEFVGLQVAFEQPRSRCRLWHEIPKLQSRERSVPRSTEAGERLIDLRVQGTDERP